MEKTNPYYNYVFGNYKQPDDSGIAKSILTHQLIKMIPTTNIYG